MSTKTDDQDVYFLNFFHRTIEYDLERESSSDHKDCLRRVQTTQAEYLCPNSSAIRCAYIYHYAPCLASTLYHHFRCLMDHNTFLLRRIILRQNFTVCCICSGLPTDFISLTRLLETTLKGCCSSVDYGTRRTEVDFVVISMDPSWTSIAEKMAKKVSDDLGGKSSVNLNLRFLAADSSMPLTDDVKEALSQSDLVTVVHFVTGACENERSARLNLMQAVVQFIPGGGVLFLLESPPWGACDDLRENLESCYESLVEIYGPLRHSVHRLRFLCRKECIRLYSKQYGWRCCALESVSYVCAWYKKTSECV